MLAPEALRAHAQHVEFLGYRELFTADHVGGTMGDPCIPLAIAAEATTTLRVGPLVVNNEFHHPVLLARAAASLDRMTGGRVVLGMGTGYARAEHDATAIELRPPRERVDRFAESLQVVRDLLDTGSCHFTGEHHQISLDDFGVTPTQPRVELLVGGHGRRVVRLAGRFADTFQFTGLTTDTAGNLSTGGFGLDHLDQRAAWLTDAQGDRTIERSAIVQVCEIAPAASVTDALCDRLGQPAEVIAATPFVLVGSVEQVVDKLERLRERLGITHYVVRDADEFAPVVDALA